MDGEMLRQQCGLPPWWGTMLARLALRQVRVTRAAAGIGLVDLAPTAVNTLTVDSPALWFAGGVLYVIFVTVSLRARPIGRAAGTAASVYLAEVVGYPLKVRSGDIRPWVWVREIERAVKQHRGMDQGLP